MFSGFNKVSTVPFGNLSNAAFVAGKMNASDIAKAIKAGKGKATLKTVSGGTLTAWMKGKDLYISDESGNKAKVTIADVNQSNGVIHVIDTVLLPKK